MRLALLSLLAFAAACSKQPQGLFVDEKSAARLYKEGDNLFLEQFVLEHHLKPQLTTRLERSGDAWTANIGMLGSLSVTPTESGVAITALGEKRSLVRVEPRDAQPPSAEALQALVRSFLLDQAAEFARTKRCSASFNLFAKEEAPERIAMTDALLRDATTLTATSTPIADRSSRWADEYDVQGTIALADLNFAEGETLKMVSTKAETILFTGHATLSRFPTETKRAPVFTMTTFAGARASRVDICGLTRRPALQYATERLGE
ncbi:MAG: hypothetical protein JNM69_42275 [Archangium sp.]|nr:hypothetical protein [Archangium sp.]